MHRHVCRYMHLCADWVQRWTFSALLHHCLYQSLKTEIFRKARALAKRFHAWGFSCYLQTAYKLWPCECRPWPICMMIVTNLLKLSSGLLEDVHPVVEAMSTQQHATDLMSPVVWSLCKNPFHVRTCKSLHQVNLILTPKSLILHSSLKSDLATHNLYNSILSWLPQQCILVINTWMLLNKSLTHLNEKIFFL